MNMKIATQKICRPLDISVSTKLNKVLLKPINASKEKQYIKEKENLILPKILQKRKINNVLNSPFEKYAKKNNFNESLQVKALSSVIFSCSIYFTFSNSKANLILVIVHIIKAIKTIRLNINDIIRILL